MSRLKEFLNESSDPMEEMLMSHLMLYLDKIHKDQNFSKNVDLTRLNIVNGKICFDMQLKHSKTQPILYSFEIDMVKKH